MDTDAVKRSKIRVYLCSSVVKNFVFLFFLSVFLLPASSFAQDQNLEKQTVSSQEIQEPPAPLPGLYQPAFCEFPVTFPEKPYTARRCDDEAQTRCYDLVSYTKVFDMASTVNFRVICNPVGQAVKDSYTGEVMKATLKAMTSRSVVEEYNTTFREEKDFKQAGLVGEGQSGKLSTIYIAQLWIGSSSALSVEAELIGEQHEEADKLLRDVLKSISHKTLSEDQLLKIKEKSKPVPPPIKQ